jgi:hypothetical protein
MIYSFCHHKSISVSDIKFFGNILQHLLELQKVQILMWTIQRDRIYDQQ